ncbi:MAG: hypothetical protein II567_03945, partial [Candidatus Riflebacteria bacterium]|nr:hypothetical protein [Candidatus Riflebacteria bacterium]
GVAIEVGANSKVSVGGSVSINEIDNSATSSVSSSTVGISGTNYKSLNVLATDSADIKSLSGMVSQGSKAAVGGSVAVNIIKGDTSTELDKVKFKADSTKLESYSDSNILTLALGCSVGGKVAVDGTVVVDNNSRNVYSTINKSTTDNATGTVDVATKRFGNTGSMAVVITGSGGVSAGAGVSVNRMTGTTKTKLSGNNLTVKNLNASSISDQDITNIGIAGSGGGTLGLSGSVSVNTLNNDTITEVSGGGKIISENNIGLIAQSDDSIKNYAGVLSVGIGVNADAGNIPANPNLDAGANDNRSKFGKFFASIGSGLKKASGKVGGISAKFGGVGIGVAVSVNSLNGKTNSYVDGVDLTAKGKDSNSKVSTKDKIENSAINDAYVDSKTININSSLADDRKQQQYTGIVVDSSSTHTVKAFIASAGVSGKVAVNANVNVNTVGGETNAYINNSTINKGLNGKTAGNVNVYAKDYTNTSGFIGNASISGTASVGASADTNKVTRNTYAKATNIKNGSVAKAFDVKAISKQGMSSFVVGLAASLQVSVAGNVSVTLLNSITSSLIDNANISVNSMDTGADHYARSHVMAGSAGIGVSTAGVGAAVVVTNDKSQSLAKVNNSKIGINSGYAGDVKINSNNDDKYDITGFSVGAGLYAGVAGTVAVNYMENQVDTTVASSTIGTSSSRANSVEIKSKDVSTINTRGGSGALGAAGVGAFVNVDTFDGQTNTNISKSKVYSTKDVNLGASEERNSDEFALSISGGVGGLSANVLVINSGKKLDFSETDSKDVQKDIDRSFDMANKALSNDYVSKHNQGTLSDAELKQILGNQPTYSASKDGKAITLTKVDGSTIDSKSGKVSSNTSADGKIAISSNGGAAGLVGVMGNFGFIYDNKNVNSQFTNSTINAANGIDLYSKAGGNTSLEMTQGSVGGFDYSGAFSYIFLNNNTSVGVAGSNLTNKTKNVNIVATDETSGNTNAKGFQFGGGAVGTIFSKVNNTSNTNTTVGKTKIDNGSSTTASNTISISATKNNKLVAEAYAGTGGGLAVTVISPVTKDYGKSAVTLSSGNVFSSNILDVYSTNMPTLNSFMKAGSGGILGVGVGDVSAYQYGSSNLTVNNGSKYNVGNVNYVANIISDAVQESKAYTVGLVDIKVNRVDSIASQTVNVNVDFAKNNYANNTILNIRGENRAKSKITVEGVGVGGVLSVCNNKAEANNDLVTNVNVRGIGDPSSFSQINVAAKSEAVNSLYANGDGGGLIAVSPYAGSVESNMNLKANANLSGNMQAETINADAVGVADYKGSTSSVQGSFAGGNGAITEATITMDTNVKVGENAKLTAKEIALKAANDIRTGYERNGLNTKSSMYGGFG